MKNSLCIWRYFSGNRRIRVKQGVLIANVRRVTLLVLALFATSFGVAQVTKVSEALTSLKDGDLITAKAAIDAASEHEETTKKAQTWYYKGYIYRELSKQQSAESLSYRRGAVKYFKKCMDIEPEGKFSANSKQQIVNIGRAYYNDAVMAINAGKAEEAEKNFVIFQAVSKIADPQVNLKLQQINVYLALGGLYTRLYEQNKEKNKDYWSKAKSYFDKVLELDSENLKGNYNIGILYYNKAVNIINRTEYDIDLIALSDIQDVSIELFNQSLPYMQTALKLEPNNENTLIGLSGIYFALNEIEKSNEIKKRLEEIKGKRNK
ncbi:MAG TPA: hypothetical protein EYM84_03655 [Flavobacteriales bacterium]|nr:hypothetical protein [Flavobacteriales bacterium]HIN39348.1 hypothetical protein [Flavobacteriales bacterium]